MEMKNKIKISVIISIYRGEKYLDNFFNAFCAIINPEEVELVIVHNNPSEEEKKIINERRASIRHLVYLSVPREGLYRSWNRGIESSSGKYVAMWNVDDVRTPDCLYRQAKYLDEHSDIAVVSGDYLKIFKYGKKTGYLKKDPVKYNKILKITKFNNGCFLMWRKSIHEKIGFFDEQLKIGGDWDFWMRVTNKYKAGRIDSLLGYYLREEGMGLSKQKMIKNYTERNTILLRYYNYKILSNPMFFLKSYRDKRISIKVDKILNSGLYREYFYTKNVISFTLTCLFFWIHLLKDTLVYYKYLIKRCVEK